ncbi:MAG: GAF domain-containing protein [Bacteroidales bacterium]|nr:GAF domain-containing protein [Bacteroidales bacterium]
MRQLINNLSIKSKILLGFFLLTAIYFILGIFQYNSLENVNHSNESINFAKDMNSTVAKIKYLLAKDVLVLRNFSTAKDNKEYTSLKKEHDDFKEKIFEVFNSVPKITERKFIDLALRKNFTDTINIIKNIYNDDYFISYEEIITSQKKIINPIELKNEVLESERIKQFEKVNLVESDSTGNNQFLVKRSDADIEEQIQDNLNELKYEQRKHYQKIVRHVNEIDKMLSIIEAKSNTISNKAVSEAVSLGRHNIKTFIIFLFIAISLSIILSFIISNMIVKPLEKLMKYASRLSEGELPEFTEEIYNDEIGETANSISQLTVGLQKTSEFAHAIGQGDFSSNYQPLSDKDVLGNSLLNMRKSLQQAKEEEIKRQREDVQRNWTTEGLALFAEILRHHTENVVELSDDIIVNLVKYLKANQGGIFIYQDIDPENVYLELLSAYAYNRKKYFKRKINIGEGLVGAAAEEKYTIYLTDIPDDYIEIESGTGSANPKSLLIVPLKIEEEVLGVIELASFNELKDYEIELVEKIAESIASTLSTARINTRTAELLEQSNSQTKVMKDQEEEMRQTIEEMRATQEDSLRREEEFYNELKEIEAINKTLEQQTSLQDSEIEKLKNNYSTSMKLVKERESFENNLYNIISGAVITTTDEGIITLVNDQFSSLLKYKSAEVIGRSVYTILGFNTNEVEMSKVLQAEFGNIVNTKGREVKIANKDGEFVIFWLSVTANIFEGKVLYTLILNDLTKLSEERKRCKGFEEELLVCRFESENKTQTLESLLQKNKIELPGFETEYTFINFEDYRIGLNIIDSQLKKWFDLINKIYGVFKRHESQKNILAAIDEFIDYTGYHFGFEEKYLKDFSYENFDEYKSTHDQFILSISSYRQSYSEGEKISLIKLVVFLKSWVQYYISLHDEKFIKLFRINGLS